MEFEKDLAFFCGPALAGIKPACLLSCCRQNYPNFYAMVAEYNGSLLKCGIRISILCDCDQRSLLLVYREGRLQNQLASPEVSRLLRAVGYPIQSGLPMMLEFLSFRIRNQAEFPHEIGLFLGYPVADVLGFLENRGKNYRYCGHWKVYSDVDKAKRTFAQYDRCRSAICRRIGEGCSIQRLFTAC
ncbi:MAG: DUF3793 family protein [Candidatus Merdivicinus sp.]